MRMVFAASIVYVCLVVDVVLLPITAVAAATTTVGVSNATDVATGNTVNGVESAASATSLNSSLYWDQYICYLCLKRNTLMIKWCPLTKDDCHLACLSSTSTTPARRPLSPSDDGEDRNSTLGTGPGGGKPDDCYVMKLYPDGRWVITLTVSCKAVAGCYLVCSHGDAVAGNGADGTTPAVAWGRQPPHASEFQRCGDQLAAAANGVYPRT